MVYLGITDMQWSDFINDVVGIIISEALETSDARYWKRIILVKTIGGNDMNLTNRIETRLWKKRLSNDSITTSQIVSELNRLFRITLAPRTRVQLESKIEQIRSRIYKRHKRWCIRRDEFARNLGVPGKLVERWFRAGWINPYNPAQIKAYYSFNLSGIIISDLSNRRGMMTGYLKIPITVLLLHKLPPCLIKGFYPRDKF